MTLDKDWLCRVANVNTGVPCSTPNYAEHTHCVACGKMRYLTDCMMASTLDPAIQSPWTREDRAKMENTWNELVKLAEMWGATLWQKHQPEQN